MRIVGLTSTSLYNYKKLGIVVHSRNVKTRMFPSWTTFFFSFVVIPFYYNVTREFLSLEMSHFSTKFHPFSFTFPPTSTTTMKKSERLAHFQVILKKVQTFNKTREREKEPFKQVSLENSKTLFYRTLLRWLFRKLSRVRLQEFYAHLCYIFCMLKNFL